MNSMQFGNPLVFLHRDLSRFDGHFGVKRKAFPTAGYVLVFFFLEKPYAWVTQSLSDNL